MQNNTKERTPWTSAELDLIVADYLSMLYEDLAGRKYVKARHNAQIAELTGRSKAAIEFKHQNVSAVLDELGMQSVHVQSVRVVIIGGNDAHDSGRRRVLNRKPGDFHLT